VLYSAQVYVQTRNMFFDNLNIHLADNLDFNMTVQLALFIISRLILGSNLNFVCVLYRVSIMLA